MRERAEETQDTSFFEQARSNERYEAGVHIWRGLFKSTNIIDSLHQDHYNCNTNYYNIYF